MNKLCKSHCFLIFAICFLSSVSMAEENSTPQVYQHPVERTVAAEKETKLGQNNISPEVVVLRAQLELAEKYQDRIIATVYWSLGTLCAIFLALIGFGWLANFKIYDRDRAALSKEMTEAVSLQLSNSTKLMMADFEIWKQDAVDSLESAIANSNKNLSKENLRLRRYAEQLEISISRLQAELWISKKMHGNAFSALIRAAEIAQQHGNSGEVAHSLDVMEKTIREMNGMFSSDLNRLSNFLDGLENAESTHANRLRSILSSTKTL